MIEPVSGKLIFGVGVNDVKGPTKYFTDEGKKVTCPFYRTWHSMLRRCYSTYHQRKSPAYVGCSVVADWHRFSKFKAWMETQDWEGKELDKDFLNRGNKAYSPYTCVFIPKKLNSFLIRCGKRHNGVDFHQKTGKYRARCSNPFSGKTEHLGLYDCQEDAYSVWCNRKKELAMKYAEMYGGDTSIMIKRYFDHNDIGI